MLASLQITSRSLSSQGASRRPASSQGRSKIFVFYRFTRRRIFRFLRAVIARIDLDHFPGSCCG
jgi:hypothetical protein